MFEDKKYRVAGPAGGPGVLGPWRPAEGTNRADARQTHQQTKASIWTRIADRARATTHYHCTT